MYLDLNFLTAYQYVVEEMRNEASLLFLMQTMDAKSKMIFCCIVWISLEYLQQPEALHQAFFFKELVANFQESVAIYFLIFIISHLE